MPSISAGGTTVELVFVGDVSSAVVDIVAAAVEEQFGVVPQHGVRVDPADFGRTTAAGPLLEAVENASTADVCVGLFDGQIRYRSKSMLSGIAMLGAGTAVISVSWVVGDDDPRTEPARSRLRKCTMRQVAHAVGLESCHRDCVLAKGGNPAELDDHPEQFCWWCRSVLDGDDPVQSSDDFGLLWSVAWLVATPLRLPLLAVAALHVRIAPDTTARDAFDRLPGPVRELIDRTINLAGFWFAVGLFVVCFALTVYAEMELYEYVLGTEPATNPLAIAIIVTSGLLALVELTVVRRLFRWTIRGTRFAYALAVASVER